MVLTSLEVSLMGGLFVIFGAGVGGLTTWLTISKRCDNCGMAGMKRDIAVQFFLIREIAQRQGVTPKEILDIEAAAVQAIGRD